MVKAIVVRAPGSNCDAELVRAFKLAGASVETVHLDKLISEPQRLESAGIVGFPGGFSYGDDIASGRIFAAKVREKLYPSLRESVQRGCMMIGVCNGFQVLVQAGLLPDPCAAGVGDAEPAAAPRQTVAVTDNIGARFVGRWVPVRYEADSVCEWTAGLGRSQARDDSDDAWLLPVAHGEGRVVTDPATLARLRSNGQVAIRYLDNYNGSMDAIAGLCDPTGRVLGLMPHPERFLEWNRHPYWTRLAPARRERVTPGFQVFINAVERCAAAV